MIAWIVLIVSNEKHFNYLLLDCMSQISPEKKKKQKSCAIETRDSEIKFLDRNALKVKTFNGIWNMLSTELEEWCEKYTKVFLKTWRKNVNVFLLQFIY